MFNAFLHVTLLDLLFFSNATFFDIARQNSAKLMIAFLDTLLVTTLPKLSLPM